MPKVLAFTARGRFAAHKDPSVTTHQLVYYAPPKSAIVGMVGAVLGTKRSETGDLYSREYKELLSELRVGVGMLNGPNDKPQKVLFGTNHRPLKWTGHMKPIKSELVENPNYRIYVVGSEGTLANLERRISSNEPVYPVYFGHAYCQARLEDARLGRAEIVGEGDTARVGSTVIKDPDGEIDPIPVGESPVIVENKLIHKVDDNGEVTRLSVAHMIPLRGTEIKVIGKSSSWQTFLSWSPDEAHGDAEVFSVF